MINIGEQWPKDNTYGFYSKWFNNGAIMGGWYTSWSAMMISGALFAGNYFGGEVLEEAEKLFQDTNWDAAIESEDDPRIWGFFGNDGQPSSASYMFSHPIIVGLLAKKQGSQKAINWWKNFVGPNQAPPGMVSQISIEILVD